jgi:O-antigen/teichoic acid export membrane protein
MNYIDWGYISNKVINIVGYSIIMLITYIFFNFSITYFRRKKTAPAKPNEKIKNYAFCFFIVVLIAALFTLRSKHNPEEFIVSFIVLALAAFWGVASGYKKDKKKYGP